MTNATLDTIKSLRTTHWDFNDREVSRESIDTIIAHSMRTANSDNLADYSIIVLDDPAIINTVTAQDCHAKCLVYCLDHHHIVETGKHMGYDYKPQFNWYNYMIYQYDICAAAQTAVIAAKSMGIDSLVTNVIHRGDMKRIQQLLNLPEQYCLPVITVVLGYSDKPIDQTTGRLSPRHITHYGTYDQSVDTEAIITEIDSIYPEYLSDEYPHTLDWYYKVWLNIMPDNPDEVKRAMHDCGFEVK
jgi:nitroreductase